MAQKLSNLPLKSKVKFGKLYSKPIVWLVADKNHSGYPSNSVTLVSEKIIKMLCFDAKEPSNTDIDRKNYGNNRYVYSNIHQWMNSSAGANAWYAAQHSADAPPSAANVWPYGNVAVNPYQSAAGFLNSFTTNERNSLLNTTITVGKSSTDGGGTETCQDKIFSLSCTEVGLTGDHVCGSKLAIFSDSYSRMAKVTAECVANSNYPSNPAANASWYWWLRDAYASSSGFAYFVPADGTLSRNYVCNGYFGLRPACNLSADLLVSDSTDSDGCYTIIYNSAPTTPSSITVPTTVIGGQNITVSWGSSTDANGNLSGYILERKADSGAWTQVYKGSSRSATVSITYGWNSVQFRVKAYDSQAAESSYTTSATRTVTNNRTPAISGSNSNLGSFSETSPSYSYTVTDADGDAVTVVETLDGKVNRSYTVTLGTENTFTLSSEAWQKVLNGSHTLAIKATDSKGASATRTLTFTKAVTSISFEQTIAMPADDMPMKALLNIQGSFPAGSILKVEICNNGNDEQPAWEDVTNRVINGQKCYFSNTEKTADSWGVKIRVNLSRGTATEPCYIQTLGGNFG